MTELNFFTESFNLKRLLRSNEDRYYVFICLSSSVALLPRLDASLDLNQTQTMLQATISTLLQSQFNSMLLSINTDSCSFK